MLLGLALFCGFASKFIHFAGAGALATLVMAFVAAVRLVQGVFNIVPRPSSSAVKLKQSNGANRLKQEIEQTMSQLVI